MQSTKNDKISRENPRMRRSDLFRGDADTVSFLSKIFPFLENR